MTVVRHLFLFGGVCIASLGCASPSPEMKRWSGEWGDGWTSIWLLPDGNFESREVPEFQSKPCATEYLKGTWTLGKGVLTLQAVQEAAVDGHEPRPRGVTVVPVHFQTQLGLEGNGAALVCRQLHLTPSNFADPRKFSIRLYKVRQEPLPNWAALQKQANELKKQADDMYKAAMSQKPNPSADPRGKIPGRPN